MKAHHQPTKKREVFFEPLRATYRPPFSRSQLRALALSAKRYAGKEHGRRLAEVLAVFVQD